MDAVIALKKTPLPRVRGSGLEEMMHSLEALSPPNV
jgi:hypothetical protein